MPWNDREAFAAAVAEHELAAILAEPIAANMGLVPPAPGFLELPALAGRRRSGALLVFDEVITGFRVARGGAQELLRRAARPDDHGQGPRRRPAAGRLRRQARADEHGRAGRRRLPGGHAVGQPAGGRGGAGDAGASSTPPPTSGWRADRHARGGPRATPRADRAVQVVRRAGPGDPVLLRRAGHRLRRRRGLRPRRLRRASAGRCSSAGIYPPPSQFEAWFVSLAHDEAAIERTVDAAREAFAEADA